MVSANAFITEAFTLLAIALLVIFLRTIARATTVGIKHFQLDDYLMLVVAIVYSLETAAAYIVGAWWHGLANNGMTDQQRADLDPLSEEYRLRIGGSKTQVIGWSLYTFLLWALKLCMITFYGRLTEGLTHMVMRIRIGYVAIGTTYIATLFSILLGCHPMAKNWQIFPDPGNHCQPAISRIDCLVTVVLNVVTDAYLISIPLPLLWKMQLPTKKKLLLMFMFSGGIFVMICGILRCVLILIDPIHGAQQAGSWAVRETFVAVVIGNIPMIYQLVRRWVKAADDSLAAHYSRRSGNSRSITKDTKDSKDSAGSSGSYAMHNRHEKRSKYIHPLSMRNATASDSAEHIVDNDATQGGISVTKEVTTMESRPFTTLDDEGSDSFNGGGAQGYAVKINAQPQRHLSRH